jgi:hypothetical protein
VLLGVVLAIVSGWWFWRNHLLYGDLLGFQTYREVFGTLRRQTPLQWSDVTELFSTQFRSYWGIFGWMNVPAPAWFHWAMAALVAVGSAGSVLGIALFPRDTFVGCQRRALGILALAVFSQEALTLVGARTFNSVWYQGRYLFPAAAPIALLIAFGIIWILSLALSRAAARIVAAVLAILLAVVAARAPFRWIAPAYDTAALRSLATVEAIQPRVSTKPTALHYGELALVGATHRPLQPPYDPSSTSTSVPSRNVR